MESPDRPIWQLCAGLIHELAQPLNAVSLSLDLPATPHGTAALDARIRAALQSGNDTLQFLQLIARIGAGTHVPAADPVPARGLLHRIAAWTGDRTDTALRIVDSSVVMLGDPDILAATLKHLLASGHRAERALLGIRHRNGRAVIRLYLMSAGPALPEPSAGLPELLRRCLGGRLETRRPAPGCHVYELDLPRAAPVP